MEPNLPHGARFDGGSQVLWEDGERVFCRGWRLDDSGERRAVLIVHLAANHPSRSDLDRLAHECGLKDELDTAWAVRPLELVRDAGRTALVLEGVDGGPLDRLLGAPMEVGRFLGFAIAITAVVGQLHRRSLVHKDIKPANILVNGATGEVRLTGFGIASRLVRERQSPHPPETIAGTLAYMAPEQTGRMNRSIDSRSDLYALGVTFYQMLTGALPFTAADPMEWVHCHLARRPAAPTERLNDVPGAVSAIVMKLLAKRAEDRYQTAGGLESDLRRCRTEWSAQSRIDYFTLGERDTPNRLLIPEKLYGREREVGTLLAAFDRVVKAGTAELVLVSGYSGIGKSSVVNELQPVLVPPRGLFAAGKFDQYKRDIPYSTLAQAFQSLVRPLLVKDDVELGDWREALREALGPNGQLMVGLVPELSFIIGEQAPVPELPPQDAQRRFQLVFRRFLSVFARPEHPLALFLDDLQWLDAATLDLLEDSLTHPDVRHVLLIGAYRDNEVTATHPLMRRLEAIRGSGRVQDIKLHPLTAEDLSGLVADSLRIAAEQATPLAGLVHAKTDGNPFFVIQFLHVLADEGLLAFDHERARWSFDLGRIHAKQYTDNVVELLAGKLTRLALDTQDALRKLACLGNVADVGMLSIVLGTPEQQVHAALWEGISQQLIERIDRSYKFTHDRVQEAAYALIPEESRAQSHLAIGRLLVLHTPPESRDEAIFEIVNQLNRGAPLIASVAEREQVAELNLAAGKRAKASSAYASALTYLNSGATVLPKDAWDRRQELAFELALHPADCEMCMGLLQAAEERLAALAPHAVDMVQRCAVASRRVELYTMIGVAERALAVGLECLRHVGIDWQAHPTKAEARAEYERIWSRLGSRAIEDCADLPLMRDAESLATLDLLIAMTIPAMYTDENLHALHVCRAVNLSLERGNSDAAPVSYASVGLIAGARFGQHDRGYRLGKIACELIERYGLKHFGGRTYFNFAVLIPWTRSFRDGIDPTRRAFQMSKEHGQPTFAAHAGRGLASLLLAVGHPLDQLEREAERALEFMRPFGFFLDRISQPLALVRMLAGKTSSFGSLDDGRFVEQSFEERTTGLPPFAMLECFYWIRKLQARFFAGDHAAAVDAAGRAERWYATSAAPALFLTEMADWGFYAALARAARCEPTGPDPYAEHRDALRRHQQQLRDWAAICPQNFADRVALVGAEIARIEGRELEAERLYEAAVKLARENEFVHNEALANELAGRFHATRGFETIANAYLREARSCYLRWGAYGKVRQLESLHPILRDPESVRVAGATIAASIEHLDFATMVKASQAVSGEVEPDKLIDALMRLAIEHAGAERGLLLLSRGNELRQEAEAMTNGDGIIVRRRDESAAPLPDSIVHYVVRTREGVLLSNASLHSIYSLDPYVRERNARSVLCLPLVNDSKMLGVLYLENNLTPHVFTPDRVTMLKVLASQAAISLENSRLYRDLADREGRIRRLVEANILGICIWNLEGGIVEANEAFLTMLQYGREDVVSGRLRWTELTPAEWREQDERAATELQSTGSFQPFEKAFFRKDGSQLPVLIGGTLFEGNGNEGVAFVLDLTERKRAETAVRESEGRFRDYAETASDWLWEIGPDYKFTLLTENAFGSDPADRIGAVFWDHALDLETEPEKWRLVWDALDSRRPFRNFVYCVAGGNGPLYVKASGKPVFDSNGKFRGYRGTGTDVTAITRAQAALRESERSWRSAIDGIPGLLAILNPNGGIEAINRQIVEYCGRSLQELKSRGTNGTFHDEDLPHLVEVFTRSIASGAPYDVEARLRRFDGEYRWFDIRGIPVRDDSGCIVRWYVLLTDIEDRTQALTRLQQMQSDFAHINRVSTMGELAASLSHEILHPIATARNNARAGLRFLAMNPPNLDEAREAIGCVVRDVDRANDIVGRVRNQIKKAPPRRDSFDLNEAVREAIFMVRSAIARNGIAVDTHLTDELVRVQGDRVQLQQVVVNLILNAVDSMSSDEKGARQLSIGIEQGRANGGVLVQVRDSGPGIDPRNVERVFEPFYTTKISGVGMGLSICRSIINGHGGRLWAEANEPRGAVFQFTLPPSQQGS
jgi:PAS domain S-box-containing protein